MEKSNTKSQQAVTMSKGELAFAKAEAIDYALGTVLINSAKYVETPAAMLEIARTVLNTRKQMVNGITD